MKFNEWEPIYCEILEDFGFSRRKDEEACSLLARILASFGHHQGPVIDELCHLIRGRSVVVCGNAPSLSQNLAAALSSIKTHVTIAADGATSSLLRFRVIPDVIVTDLDGNMEDILRSNQLGSTVVVHAHGDNHEKLKEYVPRLCRVLGTAQCAPVEGVFNFGGFTDGDRSVFLAKHFGAATIRLLGFDFHDPTVTPRKRKKLLWAERLVTLALNQP
jgi:uncharacterized Rossmann fold enzyme